MSNFGERTSQVTTRSTMRLIQGGQPEHSKMSRRLMAEKVCAGRLQNIEMDVQPLKNHHKLQQLRLRDAAL